MIKPPFHIAFAIGNCPHVFLKNFFDDLHGSSNQFFFSIHLSFHSKTFPHSLPVDIFAVTAVQSSGLF